ncbi:MAG: hypothetical protein P1V35_16745 [Planctomycetota bacterium]|nr:hypothetical protein [Planctomycetota bacterium]
MIKTFAATALIGLTSLFWTADDSVEPPLKYVLIVDGKAHEVTLDEPIQIEGEFKDPTISLKAASTRLFTYGDVEFQYPAAFGWEAEVVGDLEKTWTLSGNDFTMMYFILPAELDSESFLAAMASGFGGGDLDAREITRDFGGVKRSGHATEFEFAGIALSLEAFALPSKNGARLLVFQDSSDQVDKRSEEAKAAVELLSKTFVDRLGPDGAEK